MPLLLEWLQRPHVKEWWDDGDDTLEKVTAHYTSEPETTKRYLLLHGDDKKIPIGYFQYYLTSEGIGIDQFIGDERLIGKGIGTAALKSFVELIQNKHNPTLLIIDPDLENRRAIRCYQKAGFSYVKTIVGSNGKPLYLMHMHRRDL